MELVKIRRPFGLWDSAVTLPAWRRAWHWQIWPGMMMAAWCGWNFAAGGVLVCQPPDGQAPRDLNSEFSVRAHVGYGGGDFTVGGGQVYFADGDSGAFIANPGFWPASPGDAGLWAHGCADSVA
jgi:hypothetical protein